MRIVVSGGGTAGHISPILATIEALTSLDSSAEFLYVGQRGSMEAKIAAASGISFAEIPAGKFRRYHRSLLASLLDVRTLFMNVRDIFRFMAGFLQSFRILGEFDPDVVFIKGGYVGLPVGLAASLRKIPYVIHESDTVPGLTNRWLAKKAERIAVGFPVERYRQEFPHDKLVYTGIPIRTDILHPHRLEGLTHFGLDDKLPVILVMGGSQGAYAINEAVIDALPELVENYQVMHITGEVEIDRVRFETSRLHMNHKERYRVHSFLLNDMGLALACADVAVTRAGANTLAELAALRLPAVVIPHPHLAGNHQTSNALALARSGAVRLLREDQLTPEGLSQELRKILDSPEEQALLRKALERFAKPEAARELAETIRKIGAERAALRVEDEEPAGGEG